MTHITENLSFEEMMSNINPDALNEITNSLVGIPPLQAMCTLASCLGAISLMLSESDKDIAIHNIDEIASFAKALAKTMVITTDEPEKDLSTQDTKH